MSDIVIKVENLSKLYHIATICGTGRHPPASPGRYRQIRNPKSKIMVIHLTARVGGIGPNLARRLVELGAQVTLVDSLIPEYGGNLFNIAGIEDRVRVNISDVRDKHSIARFAARLEARNGCSASVVHRNRTKCCRMISIQRRPA